jgi:hypothetical protein
MLKKKEGLKKNTHVSYTPREDSWDRITHLPNTKPTWEKMANSWHWSVNLSKQNQEGRELGSIQPPPECLAKNLTENGRYKHLRKI